jgi:EF-hand domain pair/EF hand
MLKSIILVAALTLTAPALAAPDPMAPPTAAKPARATSGLMRYDTNGDGFVDRAEWNAGQEARFKQLDTNNDGKLTQDELFARTPGADRGNVLPTDRQVQRQTSYFQLLDTDRDGFVSKAEFMAQAAKNFARCDLDKDGRINTAECRQALRRPTGTPTRAER